MFEDFIFLALIVAIGYALGNVIDKILFFESINHSRTMQFLSGVFAPIVALPVLFLGNITVYEPWIFSLMLLSGVIFFLGGYLQMKATQIGEVSEMTLLLKAIPIFTVVLSFLFLGEILSIQEYLGLGILLSGTILVTLEPNEGIPKISPSLPNLVTIFAAFFFASSFVLTKYLLEFGTYLNVFFWQQIGFFLAAPLLIYFKPIRSEVKEVIKSPRRKGIPLFILGAIIYGVANLVNTLALRDAPASLVTAIISSDAIFVILIVAVLNKVGFDHFEENLTRKSVLIKIFAATLFIIGAYIIS